MKYSSRTLHIRNYISEALTLAAAEKIAVEAGSILETNDAVSIDFSGVTEIKPGALSRIFRRLYVALGPDAFAEKVALINITAEQYDLVRKSLITIDL